MENSGKYKERSISISISSNIPTISGVATTALR